MSECAFLKKKFIFEFLTGFFKKLIYLSDIFLRNWITSLSSQTMWFVYANMMINSYKSSVKKTVNGFELGVLTAPPLQLPPSFILLSYYTFRELYIYLAMQMILVYSHTHELSGKMQLIFLLFLWRKPVLHLLSIFLSALLIFFILSTFGILYQVAYYILLIP